VRKRVLFAALLAGVCSLGVAACGGSSDNSTTTAAAAASSAAAPATTEAPAASTAAATTEAASTAAAAGDAAAGKAVFTSNCGGCHTLADAGTKGAVGPNLDQLKPDAARVERQILNGGAVMPPKLLTGQDAKDVAAYVAAVAGK
jgi:mono/diheme cytochrome c family protein